MSNATDNEEGPKYVFEVPENELRDYECPIW